MNLPDRQLLDAAPDAMVIADQSGRIVMVNRQTEAIFGYPRDELLGQPIERLLPERFRARHQDHRNAYFDTPRVRSMGEGLALFGLHKDGTEFPVEISLSPVTSAGGTLVASAIRDATGRRQFEQSLFGIFEESLNEIFIFDARTLAFIQVNKGARQNLGYAMDELVNLTPVDIKPLLSHEEFLALIEPLASGREERLVFNTVHCRKDGSNYPVEVHLQRVTFDSVPAFAAIILDISERAEAESALQDSFDELRALAGKLKIVRDDERQHLGREIHDDLGQLLAAAKMDLSTVRASIEQPANTLTELLDSLDGLLTRAVASTRSIVSDLRPQALDNAGLFGGIEILVAEFGKRHQLKTTFLVTGELDDIADELVTPVYRLVQESLNNIGKHANASEASVTIERSDEGLTMTVTDNGVGIAQARPLRHTGFGIAGMQERVQELGGRFVLSGEAGEGTQVLVQIPMALSRGM